MASKVLVCTLGSTLPPIAFFDAETLSPCDDISRWDALLPSSVDALNVCEPSPDGRYLALWLANDPLGRGLFVVDLSTMAAVTLSGITTPTFPSVKAVKWSPDGTKLAMGYGSGTYLVVLDMTSGGSAISVTQPSVYIQGLAWSPDGTKLGCYTGSTTGAYVTWYQDTTTWAVSTPAVKPSIAPTAIQWSPSSAHLATGATFASGTPLTVYVAADWSTISIGTLPSHNVDVIAFSPDGAWLACINDVSSGVSAYAFPAMVKQALSGAISSSTYSCVFTPDSSALWTFNTSGSSRIESYPVSTWTKTSPPGAPTTYRLRSGIFSEISMRRVTTGAGAILDDAGNPAGGRKVRMYDRGGAGALIAEKTTDASGKFSASFHSWAPVDIRVMDDDAGTVHDDLTFSRVVPAVVP